MRRAKTWFGVLLVSLPFAFVGCGDDEDDGGNGSHKGGSSGSGGSTGGSATGGKGGTSGVSGTNATGGISGTNATGGKGGTNATGGISGTGGEAGGGGAGGEEGGMGGEGGEAGAGAQGGSGGAGGAMAGGGAGGKAGGGAGGATAGGGVGGASAGGGAGGAAGGAGSSGMAGSGGAAPTCDPVDPPEVYIGVMTGAEEVPTNSSTATGIAIAELSPGATQLTVSAYWENLGSNTTLGHIHGPAMPGMTMPPVFDLMPPTGATSGSVVAKQFAITAPQVGQLRGGLYYANIHSVNFGAGEIRAQLLPATVFRTGTLNGAEEVPPNGSTAMGRAVVVVFPGNTQAAVSVTWSGLSTNTTLAHVHGPAPAGMTQPPLFDLMPPLGATSGSVTHERWIFGTGHFTALESNLTYANVHSTMFGAGEIRAQLLPPCP